MAKKKGTLEEQEQRSKFTALRSFLRRCWVRWPERSAVIREAKRPYIGDNKRQKWEYQCNICKNWYKWVKSEMVVDHIIPAGTFLCEADYKTFIPNLFCDRSNLQVLCKICHTNVKTRSDLEEMKESKGHIAQFPREYSSWSNMRSRCNNSNSTGFAHYGGRGIQVCEEWHSFKNFIEDMGTRPQGTSLERLDYDGNYEKSNCVWADSVTQANNKSNNFYIDFEGKCLTLSQWATELGMLQNTLLYRLRRGWSVAEAFGKVTKASGLSVGIFDPWDINNIYLLRRQGVTQIEIGKMYNIDSSTISRLCSKMFPDSVFPSHYSEKHSKILELYEQGLSCAEISRDMDIGYTTVKYVIDKIKTAEERK